MSETEGTPAPIGGEAGKAPDAVPAPVMPESATEQSVDQKEIAERLVSPMVAQMIDKGITHKAVAKRSTQSRDEYWNLPENKKHKADQLQEFNDGLQAELNRTVPDDQKEAREAALKSIGLDKAYKEKKEKRTDKITEGGEEKDKEKEVTWDEKIYNFREKYARGDSDINTFVKDIADDCRHPDGAVDLEKFEQRLQAIEPILNVFGFDNTNADADKQANVPDLVRNFAIKDALESQKHAETKQKIQQAVEAKKSEPLDPKQKSGLDQLVAIQHDIDSTTTTTTTTTTTEPGAPAGGTTEGTEDDKSETKIELTPTLTEEQVKEKIDQAIANVKKYGEFQRLEDLLTNFEQKHDMDNLTPDEQDKYFELADELDKNCIKTDTFADMEKALQQIAQRNKDIADGNIKDAEPITGIELRLEEIQEIKYQVSQLTQGDHINSFVWIVRNEKNNALEVTEVRTRLALVDPKIVPLTHEEFDTAKKYVKQENQSDEELRSFLENHPRGKGYLREIRRQFAEYGEDFVTGKAQYNVEQLKDILATIGIDEVSPESETPSWYLWNAAKERFLAKRPEVKASLDPEKRYDSQADPYAKPDAPDSVKEAAGTSELAILSRQLGYEICRSYGQISDELKEKVKNLAEAPTTKDETKKVWEEVQRKITEQPEVNPDTFHNYELIVIGKFYMNASRELSGTNQQEQS